MDTLPSLLTRFCLPFLALAVLVRADTRPAKLGSSFFDWSRLKGTPTPVGVYRGVCDGPTATFERLEIHVTTLLPGRSSHPPHTHAQEEFILVREGTVEALINGQPHRAGAGSFFTYASRDPHNLTNVGSEPATYYVINFYTAATRTADPRPASEYASPDKLHSGVFDWEKLRVVPAADGSMRPITDSPTVTLQRFESHVTTLAPGAGRPKHRHSREELLILKEGELDVTMNDQTQRIGPGSIVFMASMDWQGNHNPGPNPATYFIIGAVSDLTPPEPK